jgi:hypothetical protein
MCPACANLNCRHPGHLKPRENRRLLSKNRKRLLLLGSFLLASVPSRAFDFSQSNNRGSNQITAVASRASTDYVRVRLPDGSYRPETYVFGRGGYHRGTDRDPTIEQYSFPDVARTMKGPLGLQGYVECIDPKDTKLLIMLYWGTSTGPSNYPDLFKSQALYDMQLTRNAMLMGYAEDLRASIGLDRNPLGWRRKDLFDDLRQNRYFVVMMAYDFQLMWREKEHKLLWETRFSLREFGHDFGRELPAMAAYASRYFGQPSHGLVRTLVPEGRVDIGEVKSLGAVPEK